jgi:hypothetical protein
MVEDLAAAAAVLEEEDLADSVAAEAAAVGLVEAGKFTDYWGTSNYLQFVRTGILLACI